MVSVSTQETRKCWLQTVKTWWVAMYSSRVKWCTCCTQTIQYWLVQTKRKLNKQLTNEGSQSRHHDWMRSYRLSRSQHWLTWLGHNPLDTTALDPSNTQGFCRMTKMTSQSRQYKERHHNCLQDIVIQHHLMVLFIIKVSLEVLITWDKGADKILASYMTPDHVINLQVYQKSNMVQS